MTDMNIICDREALYAQTRFKILRTEDQGRCLTFELADEDHTIGNALRHFILKNPQVKFCGYALPHPNERKINIQVQVYEGEAIDAFEKGLINLLVVNQLVRQRIREAGIPFRDIELEDSEDEDAEKLASMLNERL